VQSMPRSALCWLVFLLCAPPLLAATLCGTVRDTLTHEPVFAAGVFVYDTTGVFVGLHAVTDQQGAFCIDGLAAGTYALRVLVDDYQPQWVFDVVVEEGQSGIDVLLPPLTQLAPPAPNPAVDELSIHYRAPAGSLARLTICDVTGRWVRGWAAVPLEDGGTWGRAGATRENAMVAGTLRWDLTDSFGRRVAPGRYYVCFEAAGSVRVCPVLVVQ
jgi:hypothetical protein